MFRDSLHKNASMAFLVLFLLLPPWASPAVSQDATEAPSEEAGGGSFSLAWLHSALQNEDGSDYQGGRGNVSAQGMSGMFLNPTSGTLDQGQFTAQYCIIVFDNDGPDNTGHGIMATYGITDYLEAGAFVNFADNRAQDRISTVAGPLARFRILKDEEWWPELSLGGIYLDGDKKSDGLARGEIVASASKYCPIDPEGFLRGLRFHVGVRQIIRHENPSNVSANATIGYIGGEIEFPYSIYFVSEVSNKDGIIGRRGEHVPFSLGFQWRPSKVVGLSLAAIQNGGMDRMGLYVGVALGYPF